ncbi:UNVERIFIED_CONTAM: hypothetical protein FKN15_011525 [Acipenser sinensis]
MNPRCPPKRVPSAARFFTLCRLTVQPPQSYSVGGQRSSGQLTGKPADSLPDHRGRWCAKTFKPKLNKPYVIKCCKITSDGANLSTLSVNKANFSISVRTDQPHYSKEVSEMEAAHISPELPIRWAVSADRTVEIKEEVTELGCDQANERILQEETPPSSITERGTDMKLVCLGRQASEMASSHITVETPELESVHIKEESPEVESAEREHLSVRTDQPHYSKEVSEMEAAHISPELPIRWVVSADRTVEIKEEVTELGCDQANEWILQEETPPSSITERGADMTLVRLGRGRASQMASSHITVETPELESVHIKEESPEVESAEREHLSGKNST